MGNIRGRLQFQESNVQIPSSHFSSGINLKKLVEAIQILKFWKWFHRMMSSMCVQRSLIIFNSPLALRLNCLLAEFVSPHFDKTSVIFFLF